MNSNHFKLDPRLASDSIYLCHSELIQIRLHSNASLPWVIIVPVTTCIEFCELPDNFQLKITRISQIISSYFKQQLNSEKINFAAIGNVVQQLHIHVIGRHHNDPLWPDVVWGNSLPSKAYSDDEVEALKVALFGRLKGALS